MNCPFSTDLDLNKNTSFVYYQDKKELYQILKQYKIQYKSKLEDDLQFGVEIEFVKVSEFNMLILCRKHPQWEYQDEPSLMLLYPNSSGEYASPIFHNKKEEWEELKKLCLDLQKMGGEANELCGSHVHVDIHALKNDLDSWITFYQLWAIFEPVLYRLMCNGTRIRPEILTYAMPIQDLIVQTLRTLDEEFPIDREIEEEYEWNDIVTNPLLFRLWTRINHTFGYSMAVSLQHWLNLNRRDTLHIQKSLPTIEFRLANGTLDFRVIQNNVFIISRLIQLSLSFDPMVIECIGRHQNDFYQGGMFSRIEYYNEEHEELLFEFLDLICNKNEEKFDLAKQYMKK